MKVVILPVADATEATMTSAKAAGVDTLTLPLTYRP